MSINERIEVLVDEFSSISDWESRYKLIIKKGKDLGAIDPKYQTEENKVKGCQSQVWLFAELEGENLKFHADSDAAIVKGIVALLLEVYNGSTVDEVMSTKADFLDDIGLRQHLSMNRSNGLTAMLKQIQIYAMAYKAKLAMNKG